MAGTCGLTFLEGQPLQATVYGSLRKLRVSHVCQLAVAAGAAAATAAAQAAYEACLIRRGWATYAKKESFCTQNRGYKFLVVSRSTRTSVPHGGASYAYT